MTAMVTLREIQPPDAEEAARLSGELGYPVEAVEMERRIRDLDHARQVVMVACVDGRVAGWIDVGVTMHLQAGAYAEIGGLIVSDGSRSQGIGAQLVRAGEEWARQRGFERMVVRSRMTREAAHRFYLREGYEQTKTSAVFTKTLS